MSGDEDRAARIDCDAANLRERNERRPVGGRVADRVGVRGFLLHRAERDVHARQRARELRVSPFVAGREFAVSLWGATEPEHVSIGETLFLDDVRLNTYASKWDTESAEFAKTPLDYRTDVDAALREQVVAVSRAAWRAAARPVTAADLNSRPLPVTSYCHCGSGRSLCIPVSRGGFRR